MTFKVGDEVICVDAVGQEQWLKRGSVYTVAAVHCCSGHDWVGVGEFWPSCKCGALRGEALHHTWRFIKLPKQKARTEPIEVGVE